MQSIPYTDTGADIDTIDTNDANDTQPKRPLRNQSAVITGAGTGIGASIAHKLASLGATVFLCGRTLAALQQVATSIRQNRGAAQCVVCDITEIDSVAAMARAVDAHTAATGEAVSILVNNAGVMGPTSPLHQLDPVEWDRLLNTNLRGAFYCLRALVPGMIAAGRGDIIHISSVAGKNPLPNHAAYAASKWALNGLTYSLAEELREYGIRVSAICPASTETGLSPHSGKDASKMLQPEDIAHVVAMLVTQHPRAFVSEVVMRPTRKP